ncbi:ATP-dependent DNA helicase ii [Rhizopus microsporus ATCC 52813]|uniref:ATP-dependent DNA helicase II subunit 1 n=1 Tax=Rhizopus microsporus ATCC 52813 TaxID=1340429 RepID=A0A2G4SHA3_RHIZD|nr:ATP-dependent DNA helicase ii [Rhizopus microsporus ATCC 52813]PHZ08132.1 ATP-dependent DNA helicase ii [Rhizopus microsporus ATCC 52813]
MFEQDMEGIAPIQTVFDQIKRIMLYKVLAYPADQVGIILFNTEEKHNSANNERIYVLQSLDIPDASIIKEVDKYIKNISLLRDNYGSSKIECPLGDLFWVCSDVFFGSAPKYASKRMILITNNDNPTQHKPTSIQRARDLLTIGIDIELFFFNKRDALFDPNLFYTEIVKDSVHRLEHLETIVKSKQAKGRSEFRIPFRINEGLCIGVKGYNMIIEQKVSPHKYFYTSGEQVKEASTITRWKCVDTDQYLTKMDIKRAYDYGGEKIVFTSKEIEEIINFKEPGLLLLGFKSLKELEPHYQVTHPYFIYPDESQYEGSTKLFFHLLHGMIKRSKIAICSFMRRKNVAPKLAALVPQAERKDKEGNQIEPPGLQIVTLPYADEIRPIPFSSTPKADTSSIEAFKELVNKFTSKGYNPKHYENPHLRNHYNMIQAIALELESKPQSDQLLPNYEYIDQEMAQDIETAKQLVGLDTITEHDIMSAGQSVGQKRKIDQSVKTQQSSSSLDDKFDKKLKLDQDADTITVLWNNNKLQKASNASLKEFLKDNGIQPKRLKADLVAQVDELLHAKFNIRD